MEGWMIKKEIKAVEIVVLINSNSIVLKIFFPNNKKNADPKAKIKGKNNKSKVCL